MRASSPLSPIDADLRGQVCLVSGANTGIGKALALGLARLGARVVFACRSEARALAAIEEVRLLSGNPALEFAQVDFADPESIAACAQALERRHPALDVLVNNAGLWRPERVEVGGLELTFAVNALGYFRFTNALEPLLARAPQGRIVDVASKLARGLRLDDLHFRRRAYSGLQAYAQSKQANRMLAWVRAERLAARGVSVNVMHPGPVVTELNREASGLLGFAWRALFQPFARTPAQGADTALWLAAEPSLAGESGAFWQDRRPQARPFADPAACQALWDHCCELLARDPQRLRAS